MKNLNAKFERCKPKSKAKTESKEEPESKLRPDRMSKIMPPINDGQMRHPEAKDKQKDSSLSLSGREKKSPTDPTKRNIELKGSRFW